MTPSSTVIIPIIRHPPSCKQDRSGCIRRSRSCRHLPTFHCNIFRCAPCVSVPLQANDSKPSRSAYQDQQHALAGRDCLLRAGPFTLHYAIAALSLRYSSATASLRVPSSALRIQPRPPMLHLQHFIACILRSPEAPAITLFFSFRN